MQRMNMFSKKEKLPAFPEPPTVEAMRQDIINSSNDDPVFGYSFETPGNYREENRLGKFSSSDEEDDKNVDDSATLTADQTFEKVKIFVEQNTKMKSIIDNLSSLNEHLNAASSDLNTRLDVCKHQLSSEKKL